jgi:hypothetical protein
LKERCKSQRFINPKYVGPLSFSSSLDQDIPKLIGESSFFFFNSQCYPLLALDQIVQPLLNNFFFKKAKKKREKN